MRMNRFCYGAKAILLGLLATQVLASVHVYLSDLHILREVTAIVEAGCLAVPNELVAQSLGEFGPAFFGGLFFTLSLGAGISVFSLAVAWIWDRTCARRKAALLPVLLLWIAAVLAMNSRGLSPMASLYFLVVPPVVFISVARWIPKWNGKRVWVNSVLHLIPLAVLAIVWTAHAGESLFPDVRDHLLLSNPVGKAISDFYYRYTLYPAEAFKSLEQKTIRACRMAPVPGTESLRPIYSALLDHDYLPVAIGAPVDLEIAESQGWLEFNYRGEEVLRVGSRQFLDDPEGILKSLSARTDRYAPLRHAVMLGLLPGFPICLYVIAFALLRFVLGFMAGRKTSSIVAGLACLAIGLALLAPVRAGRTAMAETGDVSGALRSESWQQRVAAIKKIVAQQLEIADFPAYPELLHSLRAPEGYWLAKALGASRNPETFEDLLTLVDSADHHVVSMAFYGLGQRGDQRAVAEIVQRIIRSDHWYNQWYAYRALRRLGWRQDGSRLMPVSPRG